MKHYQEGDTHKHDGYNRWHPIIQKHSEDLHGVVIENNHLIGGVDLIKMRDEFVEYKEVLGMLNDIIKGVNTLDVIYKIDDIIKTLMTLDNEKYQEVIEIPERKRAENNQVGLP